MAHEINNHICFIKSLEFQRGDTQQESRATAETNERRLARAAVTFQHVGSGTTRAAPQGGLMLTPPLNLSFVFITKHGAVLSVLHMAVYSTVTRSKAVSTYM